MTSLKILGHAMAITAALAMQPAWSGDVASMAENCNGCHGPGGQSTDTAIPTIAGISDLVHSDALFAYKDGARKCHETKYLHGDTSRAASDMCKVVENMSEDDMEAIAVHFAGLPFVAAKQPFDAALAAKGKAIHDTDCEKCHSGGGSVAEDDASILAGQWTGYTKRMFAEYAAGEREQPKSMKAKLDSLSADDIDALLNYYASQQ